MGGGEISFQNAHKSSFVNMFANISGLEFKNYASSFSSIWAYILLNSLNHLNRKLNFHIIGKVAKKKTIEIIEYCLE